MKQIAREINKLNDKELNKELVKKLSFSKNFFDENLKIGFKINLESHDFNHVYYLLNIILDFPDIGIETI